MKIKGYKPVIVFLFKIYVMRSKFSLHEDWGTTLKAIFIFFTDSEQVL